MGMQMGYTEKEVSHMYFGKWCEMYQHFKWYHNFKMKKCLVTVQRLTGLKKTDGVD